MKNLKHGIISIILAGISFVIAFLSIIQLSNVAAFIYLALILLGFISIIYSYCTKCEGRFNCAHVFIGKIAQVFPKRKDKGYSTFDYIGLLVPLVLIIGFPQYWLWKTPELLIPFWILFIVSGLEIKKYVCVKCLNTKCVLCNKRGNCNPIFQAEK